MKPDELIAQLGPLRLPRQYVPVDPTVKQEVFLRTAELECFFGGSAGPGKAICLDTPLPTPSGWTTMRDVTVGSEVLALDGSPTVVTDVYAVIPRAESFRIVFDDGSAIDACADHQWLTFDARELAALTSRDPAWRARRRAKRPSRATGGPARPDVAAATAVRNRTANPAVTLNAPAGTIRTTREIAGTLTTPSGRRNHAVPVAAPLDLPGSVLPLDPYVFGAWLGDGNTNDGVVTTADPEIIGEFADAGFVAHRIPSSKYGWRVVGLTTALRDCGALGKHVPPVYRRASGPQRLALLQGLMDTDGTIDAAGRVEFTNTREHLSALVHEIACSLGQKPTIREGVARLNGVDIGPMWRVAWTPTVPVFRLPRKAVRQRPCTRRTNTFRYVVSCDPIPPRPMRCISVAHPSRMFLAGRSMIPTHNSWGLLMAAAQYVDLPGYHALLLRPALTEFEKPGGLIELSHQWWAGQASWNGTHRRWTFPSKATVSFGYLGNLGDLAQFKGPSYMFVGYDELTSFTESLYRGMFRVLRRPVGALEGVPLRARSASNPGDIGHCVPYGDVLTPSGWRPIAGMEVGDPVYAVAPDGSLVASTVEQTHEHEADEIVEVNARGLHMAMTPEHRVAKVGGTRDAPGSAFSLVPFEKLPGQATVFRSVTWEGTPFGPVSAPRPTDIGKARAKQPETLGPVEYARLLGWYLTEGCLIYRDRAVSIAQSKPESRARLRAFLEDECGFTVSWSAQGGIVYAPGWFEHLREVAPGLCRDKAMPRFLLDGPPDALEAFLDAAMDGDGHRSGTGGQFYTSSRQLADDVAEVAVKLGYLVRVSFRQRVNREGLTYCVNLTRRLAGGTEILTGHHLYDVGTATVRRSRITRHAGRRVYCIGVPGHHAFVLRQRGSVWVSGNSWVKQRFVDPKSREPGVNYVRATIQDNPHMDYDEYMLSLGLMDPVDRERLIKGDWDVMEEGGKFKRSSFRVVESEDVGPSVAAVRYWDLAGTEPNATNRDPDTTVGLRLDVGRDGLFTIRDIVAVRAEPADVEAVVRQTAELDGRQIEIRVEQDPGQAGKAQINHYARNVLQGFAVRPGHTKIKGRNAAKEVRARPVAAAVANGLVQLVNGPHARAFLDQVSLFPLGSHDDFVDAFAGAYNTVTNDGVPSQERRASVSVPRGRVPEPDHMSPLAGQYRSYGG